MVHLRRSKVLLGPGATAIRRHVGATVIGIDDAVRITRRDPHVVVIAVRHIERLRKGLAAIARTIEARVHRIHRVRVLRIGNDARVVPRALTQLAVFVDLGPRIAAVVRPIDAAFFRFDQRPHARRLRRRHRDADLAPESLRHARIGGDLLPTLTTVDRLEHATTRTAGVQRPRGAIRIPERRIQNVRIVRIKNQIRNAHILIAIQDFLPALAAVRGLEHATLLVRPERMPQHANPDDVRIRRVNTHAVHMVLHVEERVASPRLASVLRHPDAVARGRITANITLAAAHPDDIRIRGRDRNGSNRTAEVLVRRRLPGGAAVGGLEDAATHRSHIVLVGPLIRAGHRDRPTAAERANLAPAHADESQRVETLRHQRPR